MTDGEARFARRLGLAVGRLDWWNIKAEHTPYEWILQQIADEIEPLGDNRSDIRAARHTAELLAALVPGITQSELTERAQNLRQYLAVQQPPDDPVLTPEEAAAIKGV
jgi:hypothetical protein